MSRQTESVKAARIKNHRLGKVKFKDCQSGDVVGSHKLANYEIEEIRPNDDPSRKSSKSGVIVKIVGYTPNGMCALADEKVWLWDRKGGG